MSKVNKSPLHTLINIHEQSLKNLERVYKSIEDASIIEVVPLRLDGTKTGEPLEIIFYLDTATAIKEAILTHYNKQMSTKQQTINDLRSDIKLLNVFREHRGGLDESLKTTIVCPNGLEDIKRHYEEDDFTRGILSDIQITKTFIPDDRLPTVWRGGSYNVIAKFEDCDGYAVIGQCNFKE